jgi:hypothetical protein
VIRKWVGASTARELERLVGDPSPERLGVVIASTAAELYDSDSGAVVTREQAVSLSLTAESYKLLLATFPGRSVMSTWHGYSSCA